MLRIALNAVGAVLLVAGTIFTLQGLGYVEGSPMTDEKSWAIVGPIIAGLGLALLIAVFQRGRSNLP